MRTFHRGVLVALGSRERGLRASDLPVVARALAPDDALFVEAAAPLGAGGFEPFTALGAIARESTLLLGAVVPLEEARAPSIVAKLASALDLLAPGRIAVLFSTTRPGTAALREAIEIVQALRVAGPISYSGALHVLDGAFNEPRSPEVAALGVGAIVPAPVSAAELSALAEVSDLLVVAPDVLRAAEPGPTAQLALLLETGEAAPGFEMATVTRARRGDLATVLDSLGLAGA